MREASVSLVGRLRIGSTEIRSDLLPSFHADAVHGPLLRVSKRSSPSQNETLWNGGRVADPPYRVPTSPYGARGCWPTAGVADSLSPSRQLRWARGWPASGSRFRASPSGRA